MTSQEIYDRLKGKFGDAILEFKADAVVDPFITVAPGRMKEIGLYLREESGLEFDYLMCLSSVDSNDGNLAVVYHLNSLKHGHKLTIKVKVSRDSPVVQSVEGVWKSANWHEREAFDMMGIRFEGHPDLRRILCPDDWEGHPLRKDYKVQEFYHGMKVPY
ncbi:MAG TPA: NADH-quinone oxidoreductase subunit C [Bacteroidota bacterium]